jgi:hypothetical protein
MSNKTFAEKLLGIDRRIIYLIIFLSVCTPLLVPLGLPIKIGGYTPVVYDLIESIPDGAIVWFSNDGVASYYPDSMYQEAAMLNHLYKKNVKLVFTDLSTNAEGWQLMQNTLSKYSPIPDTKVYGVDYVFMGFIAGQESAIASLAADWKGTAPKDAYDTPLTDIPLTKNINDIHDFHLVIVITGGWDPAQNYIRQIFTPYGVPIILGGPQGTETAIVPFYLAGQVAGMMFGARTGAEYESLIGGPFYAIRVMDAQSVAHVMILVFLVIGNVGYWSLRRSGIEETLGGRRDYERDVD